MPRDESAVLADITATLQQLGHVEFEAWVRKRDLNQRLDQLDAELGRVRLAAAQAEVSRMAEVARATAAQMVEGSNGEA